MAASDFVITDICDANDPNKDDLIQQSKNTPGALMVMFQDKKYKLLSIKALAPSEDS